MRVFVTGGTGFIGSRVVRALLDDGHTVTALSRRTGTNLKKLNVTIINGTLKDENVIAAAAAEADAVLHLGFEHDFSRFQECCEQDIKVVTVIIKALSGSGKLFVNTGGTFSAGETGDALGQEDTPAQGPRAKSEDITLQVHKFSLASYYI